MEPITDDRHVHSAASLVVHSPSDDLASAKDLPPYIELVPHMRLAERAVDAGLSKWIKDKVS
jgi:hypothetical protein